MNDSLIGIKNIIFDLGGVILNLDYSKTIDAFKELGVENFESIFSQFKQSDFSNEFEIGKLSEMEFYKETIAVTKGIFSFEEHKIAWNAMLLDLPQERLSKLVQLSKNYNLFLYSNTNETHYNEFIVKVKSDFNSVFKKTYYSHQFGERKPNKSGFIKILQENNLSPSETLFVDDSVQHINSAHKLGILTKLVSTNDDFILEL
ncbi:MAG: HAD-IA family hydrolase [Flavobacteriales bacterium]